tara:strand:+ start:181 stop:783 length:603 start_codon:yes stop_codon:yes gene_type:complete
MAIPPYLAAAGITAADYTPPSAPGLLSYTRPPVPDVPLNFRGGSTFGNYVRKYPDLMADFLSNKDKHGYRNLAEYGRAHWRDFGHRPTELGGKGRTLGEASPYLSLADQMDYPFDASGTTATAGLPMPDVAGYRYEYPRYTWSGGGGGEGGKWEAAGTEKDIDKYGYYPYFPGSIEEAIYDDDGKSLRDILVGVRLIKDT